MRLLVAGRGGGTIGQTSAASMRLLVVVAALCAGRAGGTIRDTSFDYGIAETASTQLEEMLGDSWTTARVLHNGVQNGLAWDADAFRDYLDLNPMALINATAGLANATNGTADVPVDASVLVARVHGTAGAERGDALRKLLHALAKFASRSQAMIFVGLGDGTRDAGARTREHRTRLWTQPNFAGSSATTASATRSSPTCRASSATSTTSRSPSTGRGATPTTT
jgi:hypothetical protein